MDSKCCVPGCNQDGALLHKFPDPKTEQERFNQWYYAIGDGDILTLDCEEIYKSRSVCHSHFEKKYVVGKERITGAAVPTLHLPEKKLLNEESRCISCLCSYDQRRLHLYPIQTKALRIVFEETCLLVCYVCRDQALQVDKFVSTVQNNQFYLAQAESEVTGSVNANQKPVERTDTKQNVTKQRKEHDSVASGRQSEFDLHLESDHESEPEDNELSNLSNDPLELENTDGDNDTTIHEITSIKEEKDLNEDSEICTQTVDVHSKKTNARDKSEGCNEETKRNTNKRKQTGDEQSVWVDLDTGEAKKSKKKEENVLSPPLSKEAEINDLNPKIGPRSIFDLKLLLNSSLEGRGLLNLEKTSPLQNAARQRLVRIIATAILSDNPDKLIRTDVYQNWAREIVRVFPCEKSSVYFHSKLVNSSRGMVTRLAGKLPDQIHNLKRKYRESGIIEKRRRVSRPPDGSNPASPSIRLPEGYILQDQQEDEIPDAIIWLKNSSEPWETAVVKWTETTQTRLNLSKEWPIAQYFQEYPALRKSTGYVLLEKDFDELYAGMYTDIFESFPLLKEKIFNLAKTRTSAHNKDTTLNELITLKDSSEESSNIACMLLIPTLLAVTSVRLKSSTKKVWRPSKAEVREGFITHIKKYSDVRSVINARREKFDQLGLTVQPSIVIVGPSLEKITSYFLVIDDVWYDLPNILSVVSACFKLIWVVNAQYSVECVSTWMFIQHAFFKLKTKFDSESTSAHTLLGELGIDM